MRHTNCSHAATPADRAKCRRTSNADTQINRLVEHAKAHTKAKVDVPALPFADAVAAVRSRIKLEGYGSATVLLDPAFCDPDDEDAYGPRSMKIFTIADDGYVDAKVYGGCETSFFLTDCVSFECM
jgi:hypothetical protein